MPSILETCQGRLPERTFGAGEVFIAEGTRAGMLFVLAEGTVEVVKGDYVINTFSDPGAVFGEISVLLDTVHSATVRTTAPSRFFLVGDPLEFMRSTPDVALGVARLLAKRLHAMTTYLVDLKPRRSPRHGGRGAGRAQPLAARRSRPRVGSRSRPQSILTRRAPHAERAAELIASILRAQRDRAQASRG